MQYTLPLKQKQIEQSRLEAEAQKEATVKSAEAEAQAKVIDSKAELERRSLLADAEAGRIRKVASADAERMKTEATLLKDNPLLINKIIAERMSDKLQIMMVPSDARIFFNDVLKSGVSSPDAGSNAKQPATPAKTTSHPARTRRSPAHLSAAGTARAGGTSRSSSSAVCKEKFPPEFLPDAISAEMASGPAEKFYGRGLMNPVVHSPFP